MHEIKLPKLGQSVEEAPIVEWYKQEGDTVVEGEALFSIQTDKAEIDCESTASGVLRKILVAPGVDVPVLSVVALVGGADEALPDLSAYGVGGAEASSLPAEAAPAGSGGGVPAAAAVPAAPALAGAPSSGRAPSSPRARKTAAAHGVDLAGVPGSGVGGRVLAADVLALAGPGGAVRATPVARRVAANAGVDLAGVRGTGARGKVLKEDVLRAASGGAPADGAARRIPHTPMRRIIARRMSESKFTAPHYYVMVEVDMGACARLRRELPYKVSYNDMVLWAVAQRLREHPEVNARWTEDAIEAGGPVHLGMAVALEGGLVAPVLRDAHLLTLEALSAAARGLAERAKQNKLLPEDLEGNSFTVSNLGGFGVDAFTAIINQPASAILAVGQIKDRPAVIDGGIHVRPIMKVTLSSDHRVIDGAVAARFMGSVKELLEQAAF